MVTLVVPIPTKFVPCNTAAARVPGNSKRSNQASQCTTQLLMPTFFTTDRQPPPWQHHSRTVRSTHQSIQAHDSQQEVSLYCCCCRCCTMSRPTNKVDALRHFPILHVNGSPRRAARVEGVVDVHHAAVWQAHGDCGLVLGC